MISVVIPAMNEEDSIAGCIEALLSEGCGCEIIIAVGESTDRTAEIASRFGGVRVIRSDKGRGTQMNAGAEAGTGDVLLFLHADTVLDRGWAARIQSVLEDASISGGAFTFSIQSGSRKYRFVEAWVGLRCRLFSLPYGDQAIFIRKSTFGLIGGYKAIPLMEDVDLVSRLRKLGRIVILDIKAITSERRWTKKGLIRTAAENQLIMLLYRLGISPYRLARFYYR